MFKWIKGKDLQKGDVFMCSLESGHATAVRVSSIKGRDMFVEVFNMDNEWENVGAVPMQVFADEMFVKVGSK